MAITGTNFVRITRHGIQAANRFWPNIGDRYEVRRQALKLRFWRERHLHDPGKLFDHTYESIKALSGQGIYELRLDDEIGGLENIRVIFFDPPSDWVPKEQKPLPILWVLEIFPKKRDNFTTSELHRFKTSRNLLVERCYE